VTDQKGRERHLKAKYDITIEEYEAMAKAQHGACYTCGAVPAEGQRRLAVDHDHKTGLVRGLLCGLCNRALGLIRGDDPTVAEALGAYLRKPPAFDVIGKRPVPKKKRKRKLTRGKKAR
jgi:hypothetical protein